MAELWQYLFFPGSPEGCLLVGRMERATLHVPGFPKDQAFGDKDKGIAKLELGELILSEEDAARISQRFGIA